MENIKSQVMPEYRKQPAQQQPAGFLKIPAELRLQVYEHLFHVPAGAVALNEALLYSTSGLLALHLTSRQIAGETKDYLQKAQYALKRAAYVANLDDILVQARTERFNIELKQASPREMVDLSIKRAVGRYVEELKIADLSNVQKLLLRTKLLDHRNNNVTGHILYKIPGRCGRKYWMAKSVCTKRQEWKLWRLQMLKEELVYEYASEIKKQYFADERPRGPCNRSLEVWNKVYHSGFEVIEDHWEWWTFEQLDLVLYGACKALRRLAVGMHPELESTI